MAARQWLGLDHIERCGGNVPAVEEWPQRLLVKQGRSRHVDQMDARFGLKQLNLADQDIFANLAGGLTAHEPALDLAIGAAILSSYTEKPAPDGMAFVGEIGLSGEIRPAPGILARIRELKNLGFRRFCLCETQQEEAKIEEADILPVRHIKDIAEVIREH